ncbi:hypothetical protein LTR84_003213 [Exophiala bonariae]|uniref:Carrier domain-containing protein n=1 Tax=Exophiala bonariae TaxID=1690606 RepID=A0AAV9N8D3_9EURO|nr:hypothetical protein LTR84_003213 [Exophiala bonariae]
MGSVEVQDGHLVDGHAYQLLTGRADEEGFRSFQIIDLTDDQEATVTTLSDEIVLLSWFLTLLRTRDNPSLSFDWVHYIPRNGYIQDQGAECFRLGDLVTNMNATVGTIKRKISSLLQACGNTAQTIKSADSSLILSTSSRGSDYVDEFFANDVQKGTCLNVRPLYHSEGMLQYTIARHIETFVDTVRLCVANPDTTLEECMHPTESDIDQIWKFNHAAPASYEACMQDIISQQCDKTPDSVAISSWDGELTYAQVDGYSTLLAYKLRNTGVQLSDFIPLCFEKSCWTIVGVLAVMKVGATFVLLDPSLPLARLQNMVEQVGATTIVHSKMQRDLAVSILPRGRAMVVEAEGFTQLNPGSRQELPIVPPSTIMYIIFTSGSTGNPKGVMINHRTYTSSAIPRAEAVGYKENSRVLDFASYAFDVSIDSMLLTLSRGGCLCIPSDEDRMNDINGVIRKMKVNYAGITPSVARILDPDVITSLEGLGLGGEAATARDITRWGRDTRIIIGYGPCECTIGCTINSSAATGRDYVSIGHGNGANIWIVDPNDHNKLMPIGAVGELVVDGPIVGQGYLNDPEKTALVFIDDPPWLISGHQQYEGRKGRLYKTGDLGRYDPDGSAGIVFVGRKDTQVKLRGQRVELGEVEYQIKGSLPQEADVIAEVTSPQGFAGQPTLLAFIASRSKDRVVGAPLKTVTPEEAISTSLLGIDAKLAQVLPRYMIPNAFIHVNFIPVLISGKTDRKKLREFGATINIRQGDETTAVTSRPLPRLNDAEQTLAEAWSHILNIDVEVIRVDDNFFILGGDSVVAMRLVAFCATLSFSLTVADVFLHPTLSEMASVVRMSSKVTQHEVPPFSLLSSPVDQACAEASQICEVEISSIEDIYPSTPTQESLFTFSIKSTEAYVAQRVARIPDHISTSAWREAWESVVAATPMLRSRLVQLREPGLFQVVVREPITWRSTTDLKQYLSDDHGKRMELGQNLARYAIIEGSTKGERYMVWTVHHVLYDGWSESLTLNFIRDILEGRSPQPQAHMKEFVSHVRDMDESLTQDFWRRELDGAIGGQFPELPFRDYLSNPDSMLEMSFNLNTAENKASPFTMATLIRGAWVLVASQYMNNDDVVFGETLTGRDIPLPGVESIQGPLIATIPIRTRIDRTSTVDSFLQNIQQSMMTRVQYQHFGMQNIRKVSSDALYACEAHTGLVIQPELEYAASELGFDEGDPVREALHFNPYPLMLAIGTGNKRIRVAASFDSSLIDDTQMTRILDQFRETYIQLSGDVSKEISVISCLSAAELDRIWSRNQTPPLALDQQLKRLRSSTDTKEGSEYPPAVVSWVCNPRNVNQLTPIGGIGELWLEGAYLPGAYTESPRWLVDGSNAYSGREGRLHPTGDIVKVTHSGNMIFIGRKGDLTPDQGHAIDLTKLQVYITKYLPAPIRTAISFVLLSANGVKTTAQRKLIIMIEHQSHENAIGIISTDLKINLHVESQDIESPEVLVQCAMDPSLVSALKELDKSLRNELPPSMVPYTYIPVESLPHREDMSETIILELSASSVACQALAEIQDNLQQAWKKESASAPLTKPQKTIRDSWARVLDMTPDEIDLDDNFFRLGGDSVLAMRLVSNLRAQGYILSVADIFQNMRLRDVATVIRQETSSKSAQPYTPFSTIPEEDLDALIEDIRPQLSDVGGNIQDILPATSSQSVDIRATVHAPRTSIQYTTLFFDCEIDQNRLISACQNLVRRHEILRTVFVEHQSRFYQVILRDLEIAVPILQSQSDVVIEEQVKALCTSDIESQYLLGSPFCKLWYVEGKEGEKCLILGLSHAQYDGTSLPRLLQDLEALYEGKKVVDVFPFKQYVVSTGENFLQSEGLKYWQGLLKRSQLSVLDSSKERGSGGSDKSIFLETPVDVSQRPKSITTASILTAAWALTLARRLQTRDVTFGTITTGRNLTLANMENIMGPCYQFTPVRVAFDLEWTALDLLQYVQSQVAGSTAYDYIGFEKIFKECTEWSSKHDFYDSLVHYQDFEDFDTMPFAGATCKVDILNPHGDASHPLKIASFVRDGETHVGIVGSDKQRDFIQAALDQLVAIVQELATGHGEQRLFSDRSFN